MITLRLPSHFRVRGTEWLLAWIMCSRGFTLLLPSVSMNTGPGGRSMAEFASQHTWGWVGFVAGLTHLIALWINGTYRRSPHIRAFCSGVGLVIWLIVCDRMFASGVPTPAWPAYSSFVLCSGYNIACASQDARLSDDGHRESRGLKGGRC